LVDVCERRASFGEEGPPGLGQLDAARLSSKQLRIDFAFDRLDQPAQRRLLNVEPFGGSRDVPFLGDRDEIAKMP
jgi:hypothetical protein